MNSFFSDASRTRYANLTVIGSALIVVSAIALATLGVGSSQPVTQTQVTDPNAQAAVEKTRRAASDAYITTRVKSEISSNRITKGVRLHVKTRNGVVTLKGMLASQDAIDALKLAAEKVTGVKSVNVSGLAIAPTT